MLKEWGEGIFLYCDGISSNGHVQGLKEAFIYQQLAEDGKN
jgi:hypothetical protein